MKFRKFFSKKTLLITLGFSILLLLAGFALHLSLATIENVHSYKKISDTVGGFTGTLDESDMFGYSVADIGDLNDDGINDLAVGAAYDDDGGLDRGAVWILFMDIDNNVISSSKISDTSGDFNATFETEERFGWDVDGLGDLDNDGYEDILVASGYGSRAFILFLGPDGKVDEYQDIYRPGGTFVTSYFGYSAANIGDLDKDGVTDIAIGAMGQDGKGAIYIFFLNSDGSTKSSQIVSNPEAENDWFGGAVDGIGDLNNDTVEDIIVGAYCDADGASNNGAVWILFMNTDGTIASSQKISDTQGNFDETFTSTMRFGSAVSGMGDLDEDGNEDIAVGAYWYTGGGAAWIIHLNTNGTVKDYLRIPGTQQEFSGVIVDGDNFGGAIDTYGSFGTFTSLLTFNSNKNSTISSWGIKELSGTVPSGTTTGDITVTTPDGESNALNFTVESNATPNPDNEVTSYTTSVSGTISSNTTWSVNTRITGDITINAGVTLTIDPGVTVFFEANSDDLTSGDYTTDSEILIYGTLVAEGTESEPIYFTSTAETPAAGDWGQMRIYKTGVNSSFKHCAIRYGTNAITSSFRNPDGTVTASYPVENCLISNNSENGINLGVGSGNPTANDITYNNNIKNNIINNNGNNGIRISVGDGYGSDELTSTITNNTITNNSLAGIYINNSSWWVGHTDVNPVIKNNTIQDNGTYGIYLRVSGDPDGYGSDTNSSPIIENNYISDNVDNIYLYLEHKKSSGTSILAPTIKFNIIAGGTNGIYISDFISYGTITPVISNNLFYGASNYQILDVSNEVRPAYIANNNFWGITESAWDAGPQAGDTSGKVTISTFLNTSSAPMLSRVTPGAGTESETITIYGANFGTSVENDLDFDNDNRREILITARADDDEDLDSGAVYLLDLAFNRTISYDNNGGTGTITAQSGNDGDTITLSDGTGFSKANYTFQEWNTMANGTGTSYAGGASYTISSNITLYAQWDPVEYTVTFDSQGGTSVDSQTADYGTTTTEPTNLTKPGYVLSGWYTESECTNQWDFDSDTISGNTTLYAGWAIANTVGYQKISDLYGNFGAGLDTGDHLGSSVANIGDLDNDGIDDLAVGAIGDDDGGSQNGAIYILFLNSDGTVKSKSKISDTSGNFTAQFDASSEYGFGTAIAGLGDLDGDTVEDILVGANKDNDEGSNWAGAAFVIFLNTNGTAKGYSKIVPSDLPGMAFFGSSADNIGDLDNDGVIDVAIGSHWDDDGGSKKGSVFIYFLNSNGSVKDYQKISQLEGNLGLTLPSEARFGVSVTGLGDLDGDGIEDIAVGSDYDNDGGTERGCVYILFLNTNGTVKSKQKISDTQGNFTETITNGSRLGSGLKKLGDLDGDGIIDLGIGAIGSNSTYITLLNTDGTVKNSQHISSNTGGFSATLDSGDQFGTDISYLEDIDGDSKPTIAIASYGDDDGDTDKGAIYLLELDLPTSYSVTYDSNGGTGTIANQTGNPGETITLSDGTGFSKDNYTFDNWNTQADGNGTSYEGGSSYTITENSTLYAQWSAAEYTVTFDSQGGSSVSSQSVAYNTTASQPTSPTKTHYLFTGWFQEATCLNKWNFSSDTITEDTTLYANWSTISTANYQKISDTEGGFTGTLNDGDSIGESVYGIGDLNNDGIEDIAIGASSDNDGGTNRGAVWIMFMNSDGTVSSYQKISDTEGNFTGTLIDYDGFGESVANLGDLNNDGIDDLVVGALGDNDGGTDRGAAWILFMNTDGTVKNQQKISDTQGAFEGILANDNWFGIGVSGIGDLDNDNVEDIIVGASGDNDGGAYTGAVWVLFLNTDGTVKNYQKISATQGDFSGSISGSNFWGTSVAGIGDLDGDNVEDIAVGCRHSNYGGTSQGAAWILFLNSDGTVKDYQVITEGQGNFDGDLDNFDQFGESIASIDDLDGDGITDIIVGSIFDGDGGTQRGAAWILFMNRDGTVSENAKISNIQGNFNATLEDADLLGDSVAFVGDLDNDGTKDIAIGATSDDDGGPAKGAVYVLEVNAVPTRSLFYDNNEGSGSIDDQDGYVGDSITLSDGSLYSKDGHTFDNWNTQTNGSGTSYTGGASYTLNSNQTLYAQWNINQYTLTYNGNGEDSGTTPSNQTEDYNTSITISDNSGSLAKTGYTFNGWNTQVDGNGTDYSIGESFNITSDLTLYAKWTINQYTITYDGNSEDSGTAPNSTTEDYLTSISIPDNTGNLAKAGYTFGGWNTQSDGNGMNYLAGGSYTITQNETLYTKWNQVTYNITYHLDGGTNGANPDTYTVESSTINLLDPNKDSYTFEGWYTDPTFTTPITQITTGSTGDLDLYAEWSTTDYTINYHLNGGINGSNPATYNTETPTITLQDASKTGYTFDGWYTESEFTNPITQITSGSSGDLDIYAKFTVITYSITYHLDGGSNGINPSSYTIESATTALQDATKSSYDFDGWYSEAKFTNQVNQISSGTTGNLNLYAKFSPTSYSITYHLDGGTNGSNPEIYTIESSTISLEDPNKNGYTFDSWYTEAEFTNPITQITVGSSGDLDIYAKFTVITYSITYNLDGGVNGSNPANYDIEDSTIVLEEATKDGYSFQGWYTEAGLLNSINQIDTGSTENLDLYAKWGAISYGITYYLDGGTNGENPSSYTSESETIVLQNATQTGYTFDGWYTEAEFTNPITQITTGSTGNLSIYAKWNTITYSITYHLDGGSNGANPTDYNIESSNIFLNDATKTNYDFNGWYSEAEFSNEIEQISTGSSGNLDLYANFSPTPYSITYNLDGGTNGSNPSNYTVESSTISLDDATKTGYTFTGWYSESEFSNEVETINSGSTGDVNLFAKWTLVTYNITYHLDGGTNGANPGNYTIESSTISLENPNKNGYTFEGWYTNEELTNEITQITNGSTGNIDLYANWSIIIVTTTTTTTSTTSTISSTTTSSTISPTTSTTSTTIPRQTNDDETASTTSTTTTSSSTSTTSTTSTTNTDREDTTTTTSTIIKIDQKSEENIIVIGEEDNIEIKGESINPEDPTSINIRIPVAVIATNQSLDLAKMDHVKITLNENEYELQLSDNQSYFEGTIKLPDIEGIYTMVIEASYNGEVIYEESKNLKVEKGTWDKILDFLKSYWYILVLVVLVICSTVYLLIKRKHKNIGRNR